MKLSHYKLGVALFIFAILEFSNAWSLQNLIKAGGDIKSALFIASLWMFMFSASASIFLYILFIDGRWRKFSLLGLVFTSFSTVFASAFLKMALYEYIFKNPEYEKDELSKDLSISAEFSLAVGFFCSGSFAILICV